MDVVEFIRWITLCACLAGIIYSCWLLQRRVEKLESELTAFKAETERIGSALHVHTNDQER